MPVGFPIFCETECILLKGSSMIFFNLLWHSVTYIEIYKTFNKYWGKKQS